MKAQLKPRINLDDRTPLETVIPLETPFIVFIDPASSCNFKCTFCPTGHRQLIADTGRYQGAMKYDVFTKAIDDLAGFGKPIKVLRMYKDGRALPQQAPRRHDRLCQEERLCRLYRHHHQRHLPDARSASVR